MVTLCSSKSLSDIISEFSSKDRIFLADHDHSDPSIYSTVADSIPSLAKTGVKHLFLEVPSSLSDILDEKYRPLNSHSEARNLLSDWVKNPDGIMRIIDEAHDNGIIVHFADDYLDFFKGSLLMEQAEHASFPQALELRDRLLKLRERINPIVAAQINTIKDKVAVVYGSHHFDGSNDINEMAHGSSALIGLETNAFHQLEVGFINRTFPLKSDLQNEDACVYTQVPRVPSKVDRYPGR